MGVKERERECRHVGLWGKIGGAREKPEGSEGAPSWNLGSREALKLFDQVSSPSEWCFQRVTGSEWRQVGRTSREA